MGSVNQTRYSTIKVNRRDSVCRVMIDRPEANNTINDELVAEFRDVMAEVQDSVNVIVLEGRPEVFCFGADFNSVGDAPDNRTHGDHCGPAPLYDLWQKLAVGPFVSIAHVKGKANAGGVGFVASCDIVVADDSALFSLSELLFGLMPACVLPFLIRRIGTGKANYMTVTTQPVGAATALAWGLVDEVGTNSDLLVKKHLARLSRMPKAGIVRYKEYVAGLNGYLSASKEPALQANRRVFEDPENLRKIDRFVKTGKFPWERD